MSDDGDGPPQSSLMDPATAIPPRRLARLLDTFGPALILAMVVLLFTGLLAWKDAAEQMQSANLQGFSGFTQAARESTYDGLKAFLSFATFKTVLTQTVVVALASLGMTMIIVSAGIDLSVGSVVALSTVTGALLIQKGVGLPGVLVAGLGVGALVGAVNGALVAAFRLTPFIVTLGMLGAARGVAKWLAGNQTVNFKESGIGVLMTDPDPLGRLPPPGVWVALALAAIMAWVLQRTIFGRHLFAMGGNEQAATFSGIRVPRMKLLTYASAGVFFGLAGVMMLSRLQQGDPTAAIGLELDVIAAVVIGGASLSGGTGSVLGSMIGALTMAVLRTGSQYMDWPSYMQEIIIGGLIIAAVGLDKWRQSRGGAGFQPA